MVRRLLALCLAAASAVLPAVGRNHAAHDSRPLTASEKRTFFPLACAKPFAADKERNCALLRNYPRDQQAVGPISLNLSAIAYGSFTRTGADQAYVTYSGDFEPHNAGYGGGILFERTNGHWGLIRWFSGEQMDHCVALPPEMQQRMLCLSGWGGGGEDDSSIWLMRVPMSATGEVRQLPALLEAQDARDSGDGDDAGNYQCKSDRRPNEAILLSVTNLRRSYEPGVLAEAQIVYAKPRDATAACSQHHFAKVRLTKSIVRFKLEGSRIVALTPETFAKPDY